MEEKVTAIRLYSGEKFTAAEAAEAGSVCAVTGLSATWAGQGLGAAPEGKKALLEPVLSYRIVLPEGTDERTVLPKLRQLAEEDPQLHVQWRDPEIRVQLMGDVQIEILCKLIEERFDLRVGVDAGRILYRETIAAPVEGVGHFEPLRHYAEVHLLLEPLPRGSGIEYCADCSENLLDRNWQRLILTHLMEKTEGGDFRQATYRAVRQGLMGAESILLEPLYRFTIELPMEQLGRAINDIRAMSGSFEPPEERGGMMVLSGEAPVATMRNYARDLAAYTHGLGRISLFVAGYGPCHDAKQVIEEIGYDPLADLENTPDSVFCAHGAGFNVRWDKVPEYMHLESCLKPEAAEDAPILRRGNLNIDEKELEAIMEREFGPIRRKEYSAPQRSPVLYERSLPERSTKQYLIVDGYNVIFAWDGLRALAGQDLERAREALIDLLINYRGFTGCELVLVFDAYRVPDNPGARTVRDGVRIVYTAQGETGDMYIEQLANGIGKNENVRVVTSDALIQISALRSGILRVSAREFEQELLRTDEQIAALLRALQEKAGPMHSVIVRGTKKEGSQNGR